MIKHNYLQKDYTTNGVEKQLKIPFEIELKIEKSDPVMLLSQYVEEMDLTDLYSRYRLKKETKFFRFLKSLCSAEKMIWKESSVKKVVSCE